MKVQGVIAKGLRYSVLALLVLVSSCVSLAREPELLPEQENRVAGFLGPAVVFSDVSMHEDAMNLLWQPDYLVPFDRGAMKRLGTLSANNDLIEGTLYVYEATAYWVFTGTHSLGALLATVFGESQAWAGGAGGLVHTGVLGPFEAWVASEAPRRLIDQARAEGAQNFVLVGYSQGGALAVLLARWLKEVLDLPSSVVTLNAVRPFQANFVAAYDLLGIPTVNYIYRNDPVSEFPWGSDWRLPGRTRVLDGPRGGLANLDDHFLDHFFVLVDPDYRFHYPVQQPQ